MPARLKVVIAARFKVTDFVENRTVKNVVCAHSEADAPNVRFCPVCGTAKNKRETSTIYEHPKNATLEPFTDMNAKGEKVGWFAKWLNETAHNDGDDAIGGLDLIDLNPDGWEDDYALGSLVCELNVDGSSQYAAIPPEDIASTTQIVREKLHHLGLAPSEVALHFLGIAIY